MAYATTADFQSLGLPAAAVVNVPSSVQDEHLEAQASAIDAYLRGRYTLPLATPYPRAIVDCNCVMAAYAILQNYRGYNPDEFDAGFRQRYEDCMMFLRDLAKGLANLDVAADATPEREGRPRIATQEQRGW